MARHPPLGHHRRAGQDQASELERARPVTRDCSNAQTLYHYNTDGRLRENINAHGEHTHYRYDARDYLIESQHWAPSGTA
jgi:YD repeat-containing protein